MPRWLLKTEPKSHAFSDLEREGLTVWSAISKPLGSIRSAAGLSDLPLLRISRLSVMPVASAEWTSILLLSR